MPRVLLDHLAVQQFETSRHLDRAVHARHCETDTQRRLRLHQCARRTLGYMLRSEYVPLRMDNEPSPDHKAVPGLSVKAHLNDGRSDLTDRERKRLTHLLFHPTIVASEARQPSRSCAPCATRRAASTRAAKPHTRFLPGELGRYPHDWYMVSDGMYRRLQHVLGQRP